MKKEKYDELITSNDHRLNAYIGYTVHCKKEFLEKNKEYGQSWLVYRPKSLLTRIWNKAIRVRSIQDRKGQLVPDSIQSEFDAMYNYSIIALINTDRIVSDSLDAMSPLEINPIDSLETLYNQAYQKTFDLFKRKDHDYNGAWATMAISTLVDEILVKLMRAHQILKIINNVSVDESKIKLSEIFMDVANYSIFASILIKEVEVDPMD